MEKYFIESGIEYLSIEHEKIADAVSIQICNVDN